MVTAWCGRHLCVCVCVPVCVCVCVRVRACVCIPNVFINALVGSCLYISIAVNLLLHCLHVSVLAASLFVFSLVCLRHCLVFEHKSSPRAKKENALNRQIVERKDKAESLLSFGKIHTAPTEMNAPFSSETSSGNHYLLIRDALIVYCVGFLCHYFLSPAEYFHVVYFQPTTGTACAGNA